MTVYVDDADFTLHHGDVLDVLPTLPDQSVNCVITSPPYWGLRDYGTGTWQGGDPDCDHRSTTRSQNLDKLGERYSGGGHKASSDGAVVTQFRDVCGKCGATRVDRQLGLEETPAEYVGRMVDVFRQVRRVLRDDGTLWLNLGDSYANDTKWGGTTGGKHVAALHGAAGGIGREKRDTGLKQKDLVGIPWRVAFALQADGWYLRSDIIWAKPNPMPESVTDRPTKAHEYVFLLSKQPRYWFDQEAVREPAGENTHPRGKGIGAKNAGTPIGRGIKHNQDYARAINGEVVTSRNVRSVWEIATQPYAEAHFATYPQELVRRCLLAGCPEWVCGTCGKPRERIVEKTTTPTQRVHNGVYDAWSGFGKSGWLPGVQDVTTTGWSDCGHDNYRPGTVLDPFMGSGTTALVARHHGRRSIGIELNADYCQLAAKRLAQQSLLAGDAAA